MSTDEPAAPKSVRITGYWSDWVSIAWEPPESDGGSPLTGYIVEKRDVLRSSWNGKSKANMETLAFALVMILTDQLIKLNSDVP